MEKVKNRWVDYDDTETRTEQMTFSTTIEKVKDAFQVLRNYKAAEMDEVPAPFSPT